MEFRGSKQEDVTPEEYIEQVELSVEIHGMTKDNPLYGRTVIANFVFGLREGARAWWLSKPADMDRTQWSSVRECFSKDFAPVEEDISNIYQEVLQLKQGTNSIEEYLAQARYLGRLLVKHKIPTPLLTVQVWQGLRDTSTRQLLKTLMMTNSQNAQDFDSTIKVISTFYDVNMAVSFGKNPYHIHHGASATPVKSDLQQLAEALRDLAQGAGRSAAPRTARYPAAAETQTQLAPYAPKDLTAYDMPQPLEVQKKPTYERSTYAPKRRFTCVKCGIDGHGVGDCESDTQMTLDDQNRHREETGMAPISRFRWQKQQDELDARKPPEPEVTKVQLLRPPQVQGNAVFWPEQGQVVEWQPPKVEEMDDQETPVSESNAAFIEEWKDWESEEEDVPLGEALASAVYHGHAATDPRQTVETRNQRDVVGARSTQARVKRGGIVRPAGRGATPSSSRQYVVDVLEDELNSQTQTQRETPTVFVRVPPARNGTAETFDVDDEMDEDLHPRRQKKVTSTKTIKVRNEKEVRKPPAIRLLVESGEEPFTFMRGWPVGGKPDISFSQLLNASPILVRELALMLQSTVTTKRVKKGRENAAVEGMAASNVIGIGPPTPPAVFHTVEYHPNVRVDVVFIRAWIGDSELQRALIDGGAVIELAPKRTPRTLGLTIFQSETPLPVRMANQEIHEIKEYCFMDVNVCGVVARCKVYLVEGTAGYDLLLSRSWMSRVKCVHDHGNNYVTIQVATTPIVIHGRSETPKDISLLPEAQLVQQESSDSEYDVVTDSSEDSFKDDIGSKALETHLRQTRSAQRVTSALLKKLRWADEVSLESWSEISSSSTDDSDSNSGKA